MGYEQFLYTCLFTHQDNIGGHFAVRYLMEFNLNEDIQIGEEEWEEKQLDAQFKRKFKEKIGKDFDGEILFIERVESKIVSI